VSERDLQTCQFKAFVETDEDSYEEVPKSEQTVKIRPDETVEKVIEQLRRPDWRNRDVTLRVKDQVFGSAARFVEAVPRGAVAQLYLLRREFEFVLPGDKIARERFPDGAAVCDARSAARHFLDDERSDLEQIEVMGHHGEEPLGTLDNSRKPLQVVCKDPLYKFPGPIGSRRFPTCLRVGEVVQRLERDLEMRVQRSLPGDPSATRNRRLYDICSRDRSIDRKTANFSFKISFCEGLSSPHDLVPHMTVADLKGMLSFDGDSEWPGLRYGEVDCRWVNPDFARVCAGGSEIRDDAHLAQLVPSDGVLVLSVVVDYGVHLVDGSEGCRLAYRGGITPAEFWREATGLFVFPVVLCSPLALSRDPSNPVTVRRASDCAPDHRQRRRAL
jgi:hypothetical protein